jgi:hypothetical protein
VVYSSYLVLVEKQGLLTKEKFKIQHLKLNFLRLKKIENDAKAGVEKLVENNN